MASNYKNYAQALFELALEENNTEGFFEQIMQIKALFLENKDYFKIFASPALSENEKIALIDEAFSDVLLTVKNFLKLLASKSALSVFIPCADDFAELYYEAKGILPAKITSAVPISDAFKEKICDKLSKITNKKIEPDFSVDESLIGGVILSYDGKLLDASVKRKLCEIEKSFT